MRAILFSVTLFLVIPVNGQTTEVADTSKVTFEKVYEDVKAAVSGLASALKVGAEHVYTVLIKQQVVKSVINIVVYVLLLVMSVFGYHIATNRYKLAKAEEPDDWDETGNGIMCIIVNVATVALLIVFVAYSLSTMSETITGFINPEYGAMKDIMEFVK